MGFKVRSEGSIRISQAKTVETSSEKEKKAALTSMSWPGTYYQLGLDLARS